MYPSCERQEKLRAVITIITAGAERRGGLQCLQCLQCGQCGGAQCTGTKRRRERLTFTSDPRQPRHRDETRDILESGVLTSILSVLHETGFISLLYCLQQYFCFCLSKDQNKGVYNILPMATLMSRPVLVLSNWTFRYEWQLSEDRQIGSRPSAECCTHGRHKKATKCT